MTALVVKVLSLVAQRQIVAFGLQGRTANVVPEEEIRRPVSYLLSQQKSDGSFSDPHPVLHRGVLVTSTAYMLEHAVQCNSSLFIVKINMFTAWYKNRLWSQ